MNFRRFSFSSAETVDPLAVDEQLLALYPTHSELETRCQSSLSGDTFAHIMSPTRSTRSSISQVRHYEKSPEEVVEGLAPEYFITLYDPVKDHLEEISSWEKVDIIQKFMQKIEDTDSDKDVIIGHLTSMIDENYDSLMECMTKVQEVNMELCVADMQIKNARIKIHSSTSTLEGGSIKIKALHQKRRELRNTLVTLEGVKHFRDLYKKMERNINMGDIAEAAACALEVVEYLRHASFEKFAALKNIEDSVLRSLFEIRLKTDKALNRICCRKFTGEEYGKIMRSYSYLDNIVSLYAMFYHDQQTRDIDSSGFYVDSLGGLEGLAQRVSRFQLQDIDSSLHSAVVEHLYLGQQRKQRAALEIAIDGAYMTMRLEDIVDLAEVPLHLLLRKLTSDLLPACIVRVCEKLAEIVHTHFLITQWHTEGQVSTGSYVVLFEEDQSALDLINHALLQSRGGLWDELVRSITGLLQLVVFTSAVRLEDFMVMVQALNVMLKLGAEFCSTSNQALEHCMKEKTAEFFRNFHLESFSVLRMMIENEQWHAVTVQESVLGLIFSSLSSSTPSSSLNSERKGKNAAEESSHNNHKTNEETTKASFFALNSREEEKSLLEYFSTTGNPLEELIYTDDELKGSSSRTVASSLRNISSNNSLLVLVEEELAINSGLKRKDSSRRSVTIVTQSALNGLAKHCFKYLNTISLLPTVGAEILNNLLQLFDFYLCSVFNGFLPPEERQRFLSPPNKISAPAPDMSRDFEALQCFIERSLGEVVVISAKSLPTLFSDSKNDLDDNVCQKSATDMPIAPQILATEAVVEAVKMSSLLVVPETVQHANSTSCFALNERIVAAESCCFAAQILSDLKPIIVKIMPTSDETKYEQYIQEYSLVAGQLRSLVYKSACALFIPQTYYLPLIIDCAWETKKLREAPHEWVEKMVQQCRQVWDFMMLTNLFADTSSLLREQVWLELCQAAFDVVLEAYSRVRKCSSEGRAMMNMDLFALHDGLNSIHLCRPPRGKHYVDSYLRAFYLTEDELLQWVQENWQAYTYRHMHGLLHQTLSSMLTNKKFKESVTLLDNLYEFDKKDSTNKLSQMLSQRFREESKLGNLISSKFRR